MLFVILVPEMKRFFLISAGTLSLMLGVIGIFIPGLPTTPFILLAAALYARSSDRLHEKLIKNRFVGVYISQWQKNQGLTVKSKITSIILMWAMIGISVTHLDDRLVLQSIIIGVGAIGTVVMSFIVPTIKNNP